MRNSKINNHSIVVVLILFTICLATRIACMEIQGIFCYVCGPKSSESLIEVNETYAQLHFEETCDDFPLDKQNYQVECPKGFYGCMTSVSSNKKNIMRTCSRIMTVDDCQKANGDLICICNKRLCNGETSDNIFKKFSGMAIEDEDDDDDDDNEDDSENETSGDDETTSHETTTHMIESTDAYDTINEVINKKVSVSVTQQPSINKAVNFNCHKQLIFYILMFLHSLVNANF